MVDPSAIMIIDEINECVAVEHKLKNVAISFQIHDTKELFLINSVEKHFKTPVLQNSKGYQVFTQMKHFHCIRKIRAKFFTSYRYLNSISGYSG